MAHVRLTVMTTPEQHKKLLKGIQSRHYPYEGKILKGYATPVVSEVRTYDIRILKDAIPQLLADVGATDLGDPITDNNKHHIPFSWLVTRTVWLFRKLTGHYVPEYKHLDRVKFTTNGWHYAFIIGCYNDPETRKGVEEL